MPTETRDVRSYEAGVISCYKLLYVVSGTEFWSSTKSSTFSLLLSHLTHFYENDYSILHIFPIQYMNIFFIERDKHEQKFAYRMSNMWVPIINVLSWTPDKTVRYKGTSRIQRPAPRPKRNLVFCAKFINSITYQGD